MPTSAQRADWLAPRRAWQITSTANRGRVDSSVVNPSTPGIAKQASATMAEPMPIILAER